MRESARVLKPGDRVALADFIFTDDCVKDLARFGVDADRRVKQVPFVLDCAILILVRSRRTSLSGKKRVRQCRSLHGLALRLGGFAVTILINVCQPGVCLPRPANYVDCMHKCSPLPP